MEYIKKGVALVERNGYALVVSKDGKVFSLAGGLVRGKESKIEAAFRELKEETNLNGLSYEHFMDYLGQVRKINKKKYRKEARVFIVSASGYARPKNEISRIAWWKPGCGITLSENSRRVLENYFEVYVD
ncbi:NUDIX domain-containing protein [Candidatus Pacearchaeota archaeon]|nr:NUDIX domain-containing protein [Candidatus Pacearchaeota archaeon]